MTRLVLALVAVSSLAVAFASVHPPQKPDLALGSLEERTLVIPGVQRAVVADDMIVDATVAGDAVTVTGLNRGITRVELVSADGERRVLEINVGQWRGE